MKVKLSENVLILWQEYDFIPDIDFTADNTNIAVGDVVTFTLFGIFGNDPINFLWDFGDNKSSNVPNPSHVYTLEGNYTVSMMISDKDLQNDNMTKINYITVGKESESEKNTVPPPNNNNLILISVIIISGIVSTIVVLRYTGRAISKRKH